MGEGGAGGCSRLMASGPMAERGGALWEGGGTSEMGGTRWMADGASVEGRWEWEDGEAGPGAGGLMKRSARPVCRPN